MLFILLLIIGIISRFIPHLANFSPLLAIPLFSGVYLKKRYAMLLPLTTIIVTDLFLGLHNTILFTWGSILLISFIGLVIKTRKNILTITIGALSSAVLFFIITNFGVWLMGWYPPTWEGLLYCYKMAIPFFRINLLSTLGFSIIFFGIYELAVLLVKKEQIRKVLLIN